MNTVNTVIQVVAVVFMKYDERSRKLILNGEKPYFYLDVHGMKVGDLGMIFNGENFGVVRVVRTIDKNETHALERVTKPILAPFQYDASMIKDAYDALENFRDETETLRIENQIDAILNPPRGGPSFALHSPDPEISDAEMRKMVPPKRGRAY